MVLLLYIRTDLYQFPHYQLSRYIDTVAPPSHDTYRMVLPSMPVVVRPGPWRWTSEPRAMHLTLCMIWVMTTASTIWMVASRMTRAIVPVPGFYLHWYRRNGRTHKLFTLIHNVHEVYMITSCELQLPLDTDRYVPLEGGALTSSSGL